MKRWALGGFLLLLLLGAGGMALSLSGLVSIAATSGHWPVTRWFLEFSKRRSVATHTLGREAPPLNDPHLVLKGAGPYAINCSPCHGSPEQPFPRVAQGMTPPPPNLAETVPTWADEELFYLVKHGIKLTGMPAWPAPEREDEIWALVAFLRALPALSPGKYQQLAYGASTEARAASASVLEELAPPGPVRQVLAESCVRCHGRDGHGRGQPAFPRLAGQQRVYLEASLAAYADGRRNSGIMEPIAHGLDPSIRAGLADYYNRLPEAVPFPIGDPAAFERGRQLAHRGDPAARIPSCVDCHGPGGSQRRTIYPSLAGQPADYLVRQLELFRSGTRGGTDHAHLMAHVAPRLKPDEMRDVATYFASSGASTSASQPKP